MIEAWPLNQNVRTFPRNHGSLDTEIVQTGEGAPYLLCMCSRQHAAKIVEALNTLAEFEDLRNAMDLRNAVSVIEFAADTSISLSDIADGQV